MRKFTTLILNLLVLAIALPLGTMAQEVDEPVLYRDAKGYILDAPDHVRLDDPEIDREGGARVTCNIPEVVFTGLAQEVYPSTENTFVARVYSNGLLDQLCAVYYNTYYKSTENGTETAVSSISTYGTIKFNIRTQSSSTTDVSITNGSGQVGFTLLFYNVKALSLGIIDNYCVARNRPLNFTYKLNQYGVYRMHYQITTCSNSASTIPSWASGGYTSGSATCCDGASHSDYYASSCTVSSVLYETDMYMRVVSTKILAHPQGGEICPGGSKTLSVSAETCLSNGITYQWYKDGVAISGATGTSYAATEAGEYYCVTNDGREPRETEHATVTVTQMPEVTLASDQYICPNSSLDLTMPAGATYRWSDNSTAATLNVTTPNTYSVTMTSNGCTAAYSFNVQQLADVDLLADENVAICNGSSITETLSAANATNIVWNNDASLNQSSLTISQPGTYTVSANVNGCAFTDQVAVSAVQYGELISDETVAICEGDSYQVTLNANELSNIVWSGAASGNESTKTFTQPGTYNVSAEYEGCTFNDSFTLSYKTMPTVEVEPNHVLCPNGTVELTMPECDSYIWSDNSTNQTLSVTTPGTYDVTLTSNGCEMSRSFNVAAAPIYNIVEDDAVEFCYGATETLALSVNNATEIVWANDPVNNAATFEISAPGTYTVSAKVGDCTYTDQVVATQTENVNLLQFDNIQFCYGNSTTLSLTIDNAEDIVWNNDPSLNQSSIEISELGTYTVAATVNGCRYTDQIVAIETQNFDLIEAENLVICYGATATLNVPAAAINVVWNNNNELSGNSLEISEAGTYTVAADYNGCRYNDQVFATVADELTASISAGTINCNGGTANVEASVNGGLPPYAYAWNNQETTQALIGVAAGEYGYVVTDGNGCTETATITITEPAVLSVSINAGAINCNGGTITATAIVEGGVSPYTYAWNSNEIAQTIDATAGECSVIVTDNNGCTATAATTITEPVALSVSINAGTINCNGGITTAEANVIGGSEPYTYTWNNAATSATIEAGAGEYIVTVIDNNRCTAAAEAAITEPAALAVSLNAGTVNCNGGVATVEANVEGGVTPYAYAWNNAATSATIEAVAGDYVVTVTDANNCTASAITALTEPTQLTVLLNAGTILCSGGNAIVEADANGGVAPYAYTWSNGATSATIEAGAGEYIVTVTDNNRCTAVANATITEPAALVVSLNAGTINCNGGTATATAIVAGGTAPYAFSWSNGVNAATAEDLFAGTYSVTVTDDSGCEAMMSTTITEPAALTVTINAGTIGCNGTTATAEAVVEGGVAPYAFAWSNQETTQNITDVVPGNYNVAVTDGNGCTAMAYATITEPAALAVSLNAGTINCNGGVATIEANVTGGSEPYAYAWSNDATTATIEAFAGEYSLTVTDSNGCLAMASTAIEEPAAITASIIAGTINCNGGTTMAVAHANGGVAPYSYAWSNQGTAQNISNIVAGDYSVTITDNNGCTVTTSTTVTEPEYVNLIADETVNFCEGSSVIVTLVEGATNVVWGTDEVGASYEIGIAGTYSVSADVNGCHYTDQVVAVERPLPESGLNREYSYVINQTDTTIVILANADYESYSWSNGNTGNSLTIYCDTLILPFDADYNLTITTEYGCLVVDTVSVHVEMSPSSVSEYEVFEWNIVPNPSDGRFDIVGPNFDKAEMFDADGRLLHTIVTKNVDIFDIKPGMYYLRIYSGEITIVQKVLINR